MAAVVLMYHLGLGHVSDWHMKGLGLTDPTSLTDLVHPCGLSRLSNGS